MTEPKPTPRNWGGWMIALIAGGVFGAIIVLLIMRDQLLSAFWGFTGQ